MSREQAAADTDTMKKKKRTRDFKEGGSCCYKLSIKEKNRWNQSPDEVGEENRKRKIRWLSDIGPGQTRR